MLSHSSRLLLLVAILLATGPCTPLVHAGCPENTEYCQCVTDQDNCINAHSPDTVMWRCRGLPGVKEIMEMENVTKSVTCLEIVDSQIPSLDRETMALFPKLLMLLIQNSGLRTVRDDAFEDSTLIRRLYLNNNQLSEFPSVHRLPNLQMLHLSENEISTIPQGALDNNPQILEIGMDHNQLRALRGDLFANKCFLGTLDFSHNPDLEVVEDSVFNGTILRILDLAYTRISRVPVTESLRKHLTTLRLQNTYQLTRFSAFDNQPEYFYQTFPRLENVWFGYHAHCCQLVNGGHSVYGPEGRKRSIFSLLERIGSRIFGYKRVARQVSDAPAATVTIEPTHTQGVAISSSSFSSNSPSVQPSPVSTIDCLNQQLTRTTAVRDTCSTSAVPQPTATAAPTTATTETPTTSQPPQPCDPGYCSMTTIGSEGLCNHCKDTQCGDIDACGIYESLVIELCLCNSKKRSAHLPMEKRNADCGSEVPVLCANCSSLSITPPAGWFRIDSDSDLICKEDTTCLSQPLISTTAVLDTCSTSSVPQPTPTAATTTTTTDTPTTSQPPEPCDPDYCSVTTIGSEGLCNHCKDTQCGDIDACGIYESLVIELCLCNSKKRSVHLPMEKRNADCGSEVPVLCANCSSLSITPPAGWFRINSDSDLICKEDTTCLSQPLISTTAVLDTCSTSSVPQPTPTAATTTTTTDTPTTSQPPEPCDPDYCSVTTIGSEGLCNHCKDTQCGDIDACGIYESLVIELCLCNSKKRSVHLPMEKRNADCGSEVPILCANCSSLSITPPAGWFRIDSDSDLICKEDTTCLSQPLISTTAVLDTCSTSSVPQPTPTAATTTTTTDTPTTSQPPEPCDPDYCSMTTIGSEGLCNHCKDTQCGDIDACGIYESLIIELCLCNSKKRSVPMKKRNADCASEVPVLCANCSSLSLTPPAGWFRLESDLNLICIFSASTPQPTTSSPSTTTTGTTGEPTTEMQVGGMCQQDDISQFVSHSLTNCFPLSDAFNPCTNLLNDDHYLRVAIWFVIGLSFFGNGLVIIVFVIYAVIIRRASMEYFVMHFFYFNLALADFLMCVYLLTIAGQDLATLNNFSVYDVDWRIGNGCKFAGFTAILSTVVSVYVLTVITLERGYTIINAMHRKKITKKVAFVVMGIGWALGFILAFLPTTGKVSNYGSVAICLPFRIDSDLDKAYVVFLLLATGLAFLAIAIIYIVIFSHIFCKKSLSRSSNNRRKTEIKVAIRMFVLVVTNFVAWFPIAIVSLASVFGEGVVQNLDFAKWAIVLILPINSCLNPILYSLSAKVFRENFIIVLSKVNICQDRAQRIARQRAGITPSITSNQTSQSGMYGHKNSFYDRIRLLSMSSGSSSRRDSNISQLSDLEHYRLSLVSRRSSILSDSSNDDSLSGKTGLRRGSSGTSIEDPSMSIPNPSFRSNSPVGSNPMESNKSFRPGPKISVSSLGTLPEEPQDVVKINPTYMEDDQEYDGADSGTSTDINHEQTVNSEGDVMHYSQHQINVSDTANSTGESDSGHSGNYSGSPNADKNHLTDSIIQEIDFD